MDSGVDYEINLTEEEIDNLLSDTTIDCMCALTIYGKYVRFSFDGVYADKLERIEALKQSLRNVGLVEGKVKEGFFFKWSLNLFEEQALLRGLNAKLFFYLIELYRLQSFKQPIEDWVPRKMVVEVLDEELTQSRFVLFEKRFTIRTSKRVKQAVDETIKYSTESCSTHIGLPQLSCSVLADKARYRVACILIDYCGQLEDFCHYHVTKRKKRKRSPSLDVIEKVYEKVKCEAVVSRASPPSEAPKAETTKNEPDGRLEIDLEAAPVTDHASVSTEPHKAIEEKVGEKIEVEEAYPSASPLEEDPIREEEVIEIREPEPEEPPEETAEGFERVRRNAGIGEELDDGEAHYLGFARYGAYAKDWEERHERKAISYKNFLLVFFVSLALALVQLFLVPRMPQFHRWPKQFQWQPALEHLGAIVLALIIAYKATFVRTEPRRDLVLFLVTTALVFWVDTGCVISLCVSPVICCYAASQIMLWHKKRSLAWVPVAFLMTFLMVYNALTYESLLQQCLEIVKLFLVVTSFVHEQRKGSAVATVLFSPYRDLLFVVEFPLVFLYEFLEELDLI